MKKIVVPVDFSEHSEYALETAAQLARKYDAEIIALHMLEMSQAVLTSSDSEQHSKGLFFLKLAEQRFENFLDKDYLSDLKITPVVKHFKVFKEVNDVAKENGADLIIMGSHGTSGIKEVLLGSNAEKVVRHSEIPVLVVKSSPILTELEDVVYATNFAEESVEPYLEAKKLFDKLGYRMHLLHVNMPTQNFMSTVEIEKQVADFLKKAYGNIDIMNTINYVSDYTVEDGVLNFANKIGADLIAIPTHGRKGIAHFFEGSISEDIANHSALPVMTFKI